jgi:hypothetical protein
MPGQDSIAVSVFRMSHLAGGDLPAGGMLMMERVYAPEPTWYFFLLFALAGLLAWIRSYYGNVVVQTVQASANFQVTLRMFKDNSVLQKQMDQILYLFYFLNTAFLLYLLEMRFHMQPYGLHGVVLLLFNLALLAGVFMTRVLMLNMTGILFNRIGLFREYLYNIFIFNKLLGIIILPILPLMIYTGGWVRQVFYFSSIVVVLLIVLLRVARGIIFSMRKDISIFYLFLYLCALEIVPLIMLYRWIEGIL